MQNNHRIIGGINNASSLMAKKIYSLPMYPTLTDDEQGEVIKELKKLI